MNLVSVTVKSIKEQVRSFWVLLLTVMMAPFFVFVYYLINEGAKPQYDILLVNQDEGISDISQEINYGLYLSDMIESIDADTLGIPITLTLMDNRTDAVDRLKNRKADALVVIPEDFSKKIQAQSVHDSIGSVNLELVGDLTNLNYMISAIWVAETINEYALSATQQTKPIHITETSLGVSGDISEFDLFVPGILILSIIMLMFSATIAIIAEVESKTIIRLKMSRLSTVEFLSGVSIVQIGVGVVSILLTLIVAIWLGFEFHGSLLLMLLLAVLTSISIIAFSLIIAGITKTINEVLIFSNFPLFLFMFFTGAAFPIEGKELFAVAGYPITLQGLMSPTHSILALNKVLIMDMGIREIVPELVALIVITAVYFVAGVWIFHRRHMRVE